jgi:hypothetical protein
MLVFNLIDVPPPVRTTEQLSLAMAIIRCVDPLPYVAVWHLASLRRFVLCASCLAEAHPCFLSLSHVVAAACDWCGSCS